MRKTLLIMILPLALLVGCDGVTDDGATAPTHHTLSPDAFAGPNELWYGDPDRYWRDVFVNFNTEDAGGTNPTLTTVSDAEHGKVWRIRKPAGAKRAEISRAKGYEQQEGETIYIGWRWKASIAGSAQPSGSGFATFQWKTAGAVSRQNYPFQMSYNGRTLSLNLYGPGSPDWTEGPSIQRRRNTVWRKDVAEGEWVDLVLGIKVSRYDGTDNGRKGHVEIWFDGQKQTLTPENGVTEYDVELSGDRTRVFHRTNDGTLTYPKWGAYGGPTRDFDITVWLDEMRIGRDYASAAPPSAGVSGLDGTYVFRNVATGRYLDSDGRAVKVGTSRSGADKRWRLVASSPGFYNIDNLFSGRGVLDTEPNKVVVGSTAEPVSRTDGRQWQAERVGANVYRFRNKASGRGYLAARTGDYAVEWTPWDGARSQWELIRP